ncbi:NAD-dependent deacetylase [Prauserella rugosa]|uniref:protein acetyllysine N-acetyltransferase n=2 Tax=Prauserella rugosa TaxID=43354 RepID=A0A660C409_9PSEU|nr:NAD-dependent deacetylase [Prauserella rugosa]
MDSDTDLRRARELVTGASRVTALTGAGVSTASGIPDFRGPNGLWTKDPEAEKLSNLQAYVGSRDVRVRAWRARLDHPAWRAQPNAAHEAFVALERSGRLGAIVTQNIDELHQRAGSSPDAVIELHGTMFHTECLDCGDRRDMQEALERVRAGEDDPPCLVCGGMLKSATISFGQALDGAVLEAARIAAVTCDVLLAAGTSLTVHPAAGLVEIAAQAGASVVICNASPTPYDEVADVVLSGPLDEVLPRIT